MLKKKRLGKRIASTAVSIFVVLMFSSTSVLAQSNQSFICTAPGLSDALENLLIVFVVIAGLVAIAGGTFFTMASAVRPSESEEYGTRRNKAVIYGLGSLVILYGGNAVVGQISDNSSLNYSCILPFV